MDDETVTAKLAELAAAKNESRRLSEHADDIALELLATRQWGMRTRVAQALGVTPEAVRQKYGAHTRTN